MKIHNYIDGKFKSNKTFLKKLNPHNNKLLSHYPLSGSDDINLAINSCEKNIDKWKSFGVFERSRVLKELTNLFIDNKKKLIEAISRETGKSKNDASNEFNGCLILAEYFYSEGLRFYGRVINSTDRNKNTRSILEPLGIAALIVPANTPFANICWKIFPALLCGNTVILKSSENAPYLSYIISKLFDKTSSPKGVFNVIHGDYTTGSKLVKNKKVNLISFTGSSKAGISINQQTAVNLPKISLELGGKNCLVVYKDADLDLAVEWSIKSSFSNAGQRCSSSSKLIIHKEIYEEFKKKLVFHTKKISIGISDKDLVGPLITKKQLLYIANIIKSLDKKKYKVIQGGNIIKSGKFKYGNYFEPTIIEKISKKGLLDSTELFAPVVTLEIFHDIESVISEINSSKYGLTSAIHTNDINVSDKFSRKVRTGVVNINLGTYGSEPHMPFGGFNFSGNGTREPGLEALNFYSDIKVISNKNYDL